MFFLRAVIALGRFAFANLGVAFGSCGFGALTGLRFAFSAGLSISFALSAGGFGAFTGLRFALGAGLGISFAFSACGFGAFAGLRFALGAGLGISFAFRASLSFGPLLRFLMSLLSSGALLLIALGASLSFGPLLRFLMSLLSSGALLLIALGAGLSFAVAFSACSFGLLAGAGFLFGPFLGVALLSGLTAGLLLGLLLRLFTGGTLLSVATGLGLRLGAMLGFLGLTSLLLSLGLTINLSLTLDLGDRLFFAFGLGLLLSLAFGSGGVRALTGLSFTFVPGVALSPFISSLLGADSGFPRFGLFLGFGLGGAFSAGPSLVQPGFLHGFGLSVSFAILFWAAGLGLAWVVLASPGGFSAATSLVELVYLSLGLSLASGCGAFAGFVQPGFRLRLGLNLGGLSCRLRVTTLGFGACGFGAATGFIQLGVLLSLGLRGAFVAGLDLGALLGQGFLLITRLAAVVIQAVYLFFPEARLFLALQLNPGLFVGEVLRLLLFFQQIRLATLGGVFEIAGFTLLT